MYWTMRSGGSTGEAAAAEPLPGQAFTQRAGGSVIKGKKSKKDADPPPGSDVFSRVGGRVIDGEHEPEFTPQTGPPITHRAGGTKRRLATG